MKTLDKRIYIYKNGRWFDETDKKSRPNIYLYVSEELHDLLYNELTNDTGLSDKNIKKLVKKLRESCSQVCKIKDIVTHVETNVRTIDFEFDSDPFLLGFDNGVYDLKNDEF